MVKILKYIVMLIYFFRVVAIYDPTIMFVTKTLSLLKGFFLKIFYFILMNQLLDGLVLGKNSAFGVTNNEIWKSVPFHV